MQIIAGSDECICIAVDAILEKREHRSMSVGTVSSRQIRPSGPGETINGMAGLLRACAHLSTAYGY